MIRISAIILVIFLSLQIQAKAYSNMMGDCNSNDTTLHYENFAFAQTDTLGRYLHIIPFYCNVSAIYSIKNQKRLTPPFSNIEYNNDYYELDSCTLRLIWSEVDISNNSDEFLLEIHHNDIPIALIYGSMDATGFQQATDSVLTNYAYFQSFDTSKDFSDQYDEKELNYNEVIATTDYHLYEIRDKNRDDIIIGLKYKSPYLQAEKKKVFLRKN